MARRFAALAPQPTTLAEAWRCIHPPRVLLVEDDPGLRDALGRTLGELGVKVLEVASAASAEELLVPGPWRRARAQVAPDLIVLGDLPPVGLGVLEALRRLRVVDPETPVVVVATASSFMARVEAARLGVAAFLDKPIDVAELASLIARLAQTPWRGGVEPRPRGLSRGGASRRWG